MQIARLARIRIREDELPKIQAKFTAVLEAFRALNEVDTNGVEPLFHAVEKMELRPDEPEAPLAPEKLLANAPDAFESSFRLPRVVGGDE
jgi:aspartyl-tRNA(Asn)/glutamyl-tRNA(Gln) amidotransferase subunit C